MVERLRKEAAYWKEEALRYRFLFRFLFVYLIFDLLIHFDFLKWMKDSNNRYNSSEVDY